MKYELGDVVRTPFGEGKIAGIIECFYIAKDKSSLYSISFNEKKYHNGFIGYYKEAGRLETHLVPNDEDSCWNFFENEIFCLVKKE